MEPLSKEQLLEQSRQAKERLRKELAKLPIETKLKMMAQLVKISREAGRLPDWYERLMAKP